MQERPRRGFGARLARHFDQNRTAVIQRACQRRLELGWTCCSIGLCAKALRELDEVRIGETLADEVSFESHLLIAQDISEAAIVEYDGNEVDLIVHRCCEFLDPKHESTVAAYRNDGL